jgi:hypothetical protein
VVVDEMQSWVMIEKSVEPEPSDMEQAVREAATEAGHTLS